jgi:hypothetical protein
VVSAAAVAVSGEAKADSADHAKVAREAIADREKAVREATADREKAVRVATADREKAVRVDIEAHEKGDAMMRRGRAAVGSGREDAAARGVARASRPQLHPQSKQPDSLSHFMIDHSPIGRLCESRFERMSVLNRLMSIGSCCIRRSWVKCPNSGLHSISMENR